MRLPGADRPYRLLILGANGVFGQRVVRRLTQCANLEIAVGCRTRVKAKTLARTMGNNVNPVWGDLRDRNELNA